MTGTQRLERLRRARRDQVVGPQARAATSAWAGVIEFGGFEGEVEPTEDVLEAIEKVVF